VAVKWSSYDHSHASHRDWLQIAALGSASLWAVLLPLSGTCFRWTGSLAWRWACLAWFGILVVSGWISFLPGYLDHIKFTDGLVAHSHLAMAGFTTSFCMHLLSAVVPGGVAQSLNRRLPFIAWHLATLGYVLLMSAAGLLEGRDPAFTHTSNWPRELLYGGRTLCGAVLTAVSLFWWLGSHRFFQQREA
jgi:cytochrome c oxidase cbb3-type subunit 1